ncbi:MAG TPA: hypothetical protein VGM92_06895, partial [Candidatus Kapabacteria bacterium]
TPAAEAKTLDLLVWGQYTTAFSGLNGGIFKSDSTTDVFDQTIASAIDQNTSDHRTRADAIAELQMPLLAEARTKLAAYASSEARTILSADPTFPAWVNPSAQGTRIGLSLDQPLALSIGEFLTSAHLLGDVQRIVKDSTMTTSQPIAETRLSATVSDSLALKKALRISLFGFARTVESNLAISGGAVNAQVLPSIGFSGSLGLTDAISFHASYQFSKDRATLSPTPQATYTLQNIGGWFDAHFPFASRDSIAFHAGYLDRNEPEGIVYPDPNDTLRTPPIFSSANLHTQSATLAFDAYLSNFHWGTSVTYFPKTVPLSAYTETPSLEAPLPNRFFGFTGVYYENEFNEGNLRLTIGPRVRLMSTLDPQLSYDPASDYYVYRGAAYADVNNTIVPLSSLDSRVSSPQYMIDLLISAEVDRRAQISMEFLNVTSAPDYNVTLYPRDGFHWRLDVVWAFLD